MTSIGSRAYACGLHRQQPRGMARLQGTLGDALLWKMEVVAGEP
jgi:hypothetical protein